MNSKLKTHSQRSETTTLKLKPLGGPEVQLIQSAFRVDADRHVALHRPLDWTALQRLALRHGVLPLVYKRLREDAPDLVPAAVMQRLATWQRAHEFRVLRMTTDLPRRAVTNLQAVGSSGRQYM